MKVLPTFEEARRLVLERVTPLEAQSVDLIDSLSLVTAEDVSVPWEMPLCDNSAMDGYAVRTADCTEGARLHVLGVITAGSDAEFEVTPGCAVRIMTGGRLPKGADAVVPFEHAEAEGEGDFVTPKKAVKLHQHVRFTGSDFHEGEIALPAGAVVRPAEISLMASLGRTQIAVHRRPVVVILSTGDEVLELGSRPAPGKVIDSNGVSLAASARACGAEVHLLGIARDNEASHVEKMTEGLKADVFITSAGVSVGERDLVRKVLTDLGFEQVFHSVAMRPGGPTTFGMRGKTLVFCLPGNPVASMLTFAEFVKPALRKAMGHAQVLPKMLRAVLQSQVGKREGVVRLLRVRLEERDGALLAFDAGDQATGMLNTLVHSDGWAVLPSERTSFAPGDEVDVHLM